MRMEDLACAAGEKSTIAACVGLVADPWSAAGTRCNAVRVDAQK
jgi:hypothetical protein